MACLVTGLVVVTGIHQAHAMLLHWTQTSHGTMPALVVCIDNSPVLHFMGSSGPGTASDMPAHLQHGSI